MLVVKKNKKLLKLQTKINKGWKFKFDKFSVVRSKFSKKKPRKLKPKIFKKNNLILKRSKNRILRSLTNNNLKFLVKFFYLRKFFNVSIPNNLALVKCFLENKDAKALILYYRQIWLKRTKLRISSLNYFIFAKFVNTMMKHGKKDLALKLVKLFCFKVSKYYLTDPFKLLYSAVLKVSPPFRLKKKRVAGQVYRVPLYLRWEDQLHYGIAIIIISVRERQKSNFIDTLIEELFDIHNNSNNSISLQKFNAICDIGILNKYYIKFL